MTTERYERFTPPPANQWQDWVNLILGIWLFISPWVLGFAVAAPSEAGAAGNAAASTPLVNASWNAWILGVLIAIASVAAIVRMMPWEEWALLVLGVWTFIAPWVLGFSGVNPANWNHWIVGIIVAAIAAYSLSMIRSAVSPNLAHAGDRPDRRNL